MANPVDLGRFPELIAALAADGRGVTLLPIVKGMRRGGFGSDDTYSNDGWAVGWITPSGGDDLAIGPTIAEAVERALFELGS